MSTLEANMPRTHNVSLQGVTQATAVELTATQTTAVELTVTQTTAVELTVTALSCPVLW